MLYPTELSEVSYQQIFKDFQDEAVSWKGALSNKDPEISQNSTQKSGKIPHKHARQSRRRSKNVLINTDTVKKVYPGGFANGDYDKYRNF